MGQTPSMLAVEESGPDRHQVVLMLHGAGLNRHQWDRLVQDLPEYRCIVPDLPGHGGSRHAGPLRLDNAASQVEELVEALPADAPVHLVGSSLGASLALVLAGRRPRRYTSLLVSGASAGFSPTVVPAAASRAWARTLIPLRMRVHQSFDRIRLTQAQRQVFWQDMERGVSGTFLTALYTDLQKVAPPQSPTPTLAVVGSDEGWLAKQSARAIAARMPNAQAWEVPGMEHAWNFEDPELFSRLTRTWLLDRKVVAGLTPLV